MTDRLAVARDLLRRYPLIDGHNDLPWEIRDVFGGDPVRARLTDPVPQTQTDLPRLADGGVGAQFWSVYVPGTLAGDAAVTAVLEQIDLVHRMVRAYPDRLALATARGRRGTDLRRRESRLAAGRRGRPLDRVAHSACSAPCTRSASVI